MINCRVVSGMGLWLLSLENLWKKSLKLSPRWEALPCTMVYALQAEHAASSGQGIKFKLHPQILDLIFHSPLKVFRKSLQACTLHLPHWNISMVKKCVNTTLVPPVDVWPILLVHAAGLSRWLGLVGCAGMRGLRWRFRFLLKAQEESSACFCCSIWSLERVLNVPMNYSNMVRFEVLLPSVQIRINFKDVFYNQKLPSNASYYLAPYLHFLQCLHFVLLPLSPSALCNPSLTFPSRSLSRSLSWPPRVFSFVCLSFCFSPPWVFFSCVSSPCVPSLIFPFAPPIFDFDFRVASRPLLWLLFCRSFSLWLSFLSPLFSCLFSLTRFCPIIAGE